MAALSSPVDTQDLAHSRNLSTLSNAPLLTNRAFDSYPTEPLLRSPLASIAAGNEGITPAELSRNPATPVTGKSLFRNVLYAFQRQAKVIALSLELIMGIWATYNTVRYFLAFLRYRDTLGQVFALSLAITAGISAVLTLCAMALSRYILRFLSGQDSKKFQSMFIWLRLLSAFFLLAPAAINIALVFVWKTSPNSELDLYSRCHLDVDVVWSIAPNKCPNDAPPWSLWIALSFIRFLLTASLITAYLMTSFFTPTKSSHRHSRWLHSDVGSHQPSLAQIRSLTDRHPSDSTLVVSLNADSSPQNGLSRLARSRSFDTSPDFKLHGRMATRGGEADREMPGFVDRFRSLISQITQEMEGTLEVARSDSPPFAESYTSIPKPYPAEFSDIDANDDNYYFTHNDKDNMFNLPPVPMALGYNEFGVPYPPEENVRVLGGFVRRMPTIESQGSDEMTHGSSVTSHRHDGGAGHRTSSTQNTLLTVSTTGHGSVPPSRANSLSNRMLSISPVSTTSEHGELLGRIDHRLSTPSGERTFRSLSSTTDATMASSESRGTVTTYHTASMGDSHSPTTVYRDGTPVERDI